MSSSQLSLTGRDSARYEIVFDGGALGNPGLGYGSYEITSNGSILRPVHREEYGDNVTNNQAEYRTLIAALRWLADYLGADRASASVLVNGDSQLVLNQLMGRWKVKNEGLRPFWQEARELIAAFGDVQLVWHDRSNSVRRLGH
jgi:probable phosphoglycerate mutase